MKKIGLTGNIASGKTTVENILKDKGYKVIDADFICHEAISNDTNIIQQITDAFVDYDILDNSKNISRTKLGSIVFKNKICKEKLESILHPYVIEKIGEYFCSYKKDSLVFASVPLLFEIHLEDMFDKIIFVSADENIREKRLIQRNNYKKKEAVIRINAQNKEDDKIKKSDFIIFNNGSLDELIKNTNMVIKQLELLQ